MKNRHFCMNISKVPNSLTRNTVSPLLIGNHLLKMSVKLKFQGVHFESIVYSGGLNWFPICIY